MKRWLVPAAALLFAGNVFAAEINDLSTTDGSNTGRFPENMNPSAVNDGARALEGMLARGLKDVIDGYFVARTGLTWRKIWSTQYSGDFPGVTRTSKSAGGENMLLVSS